MHKTCRFEPQPDGGCKCVDCGFFIRHKSASCDMIARRCVATSSHAAAPTGSIVKRYATAVMEWKKAGMPVRSDEQVAEIYDRHCGVCDKLDKTTGRCSLCGCRVCGKTDGVFTIMSLVLPKTARAFVNKIRMATEHCPIQKW